MRKWVSSDEAGEIMGIKKSMVARLCRRRELCAINIDGGWRVLEESARARGSHVPTGRPRADDVRTVYEGDALDAEERKAVDLLAERGLIRIEKLPKNPFTNGTV